MIQSKVQMKVKAHDILAGRDDGRLRVPAVPPRALVAAEVVAGEPVVVVGVQAKVVLADILVRVRLDPVEHQVREHEVGRSKLGKHRNGAGRESGEMHLEGLVLEVGRLVQTADEEI